MTTRLMSFKPDFTKPDPWAGVPADYAGVATFVPTTDNPVPPWEGNISAAVIPSFNTPQYDVIALKVISEARALTSSGSPEEQAWANRVINSGERAIVARRALKGDDKEGVGIGFLALAVVAIAAVTRKK